MAAIKQALEIAMVRVKEFDEALRFYTEGLGMKVLDRFEVEMRRVTAIYVGFDDYRSGALELVHPWDIDESYTHGTGYGHIAIGVPDIDATLGKLGSMGYEITLQPKVVVPGGPHIAFVKDPDGYSVELIQIRRN